MGYDYSYYDYGYQAGEEAVNMVLGFLGLFLLIYLLIFVFSIVSYVLQSLGIYTIAKRRDIKHAWLAWIPVGNMWIWGSIADQYQYVAKGRVKNRRKILLVLNIISMVLSSVVVNGIFSALGNVIMNADMLEYMSDAQAIQLMAPMFNAMGLSAVMSIIAIVLAVFQYIALYDIYNSCDPSNAVIFLVLSILFGVVQPFFIFASRKKDLGMPPRRPQVADGFQNPPQPPVWQNDPWQNNQNGM